ncbi:MAG TPA: tripartite tricarboxylate transporter substrate binding protein [Burkholderiales bacterium]|jgi:tripartite-type tricarboxylate transporter receptor subunit TctC|nr:tripartite tricarboxylate transporter substrate binding protein [Burkholderiales bacterium]
MNSPAVLRRLFVACAAAMAMAASFCVFAQQTYPSRPIRMIVPFTPAGGSDLVARAVAPKLAAAWGQQVVVDNRPGAGTVIGTELVVKAPPDGYTMLQGGASLSITPSLRRNLPYDVRKDLIPVTQVATQAYLLAVYPGFPAKSVAQLLALAKQKPGQINFGASVGSGGHLSGELFKLMTGAQIVHIPYKGAGPAIIDLIGGQIVLVFADALAVLPYLNSSKLRAIAATTSRRASMLPDVPTVAESGVPGYESSSWYGLLVPAGTPKDIIAKLNGEIIRILRVPETREWFVGAGLEPIGNSPAEFAALIEAETQKWAKVIKAAHIPTE